MCLDENGLIVSESAGKHLSHLNGGGIERGSHVGRIPEHQSTILDPIAEEDPEFVGNGDINAKDGRQELCVASGFDRRGRQQICQCMAHAAVAHGQGCVIEDAACVQFRGEGADNPALFGFGEVSHTVMSQGCSLGPSASAGPMNMTQALSSSL